MPGSGLCAPRVCTTVHELDRFPFLPILRRALDPDIDDKDDPPIVPTFVERVNNAHRPRHGAVQHVAVALIFPSYGVENSDRPRALSVGKRHEVSTAEQ